MKIKGLTIAGFRGFRVPQTIPFDADVVVIHGPNGSGKSSIVEALEWLLLGDISRRERASSKSEYRGDYLRNLHCRQNEPTFVEAQILSDNRELVIRREYHSPRRHKLLVDGNEVDDLATFGLQVEPHTRPILSQGEIKRFVDTEQADRHTEMACILGIDVLGELRRSLMNLRNAMERDTTLNEAIRLRNARSADMKQYDELSPLSNVIESLPYQHKNFLGVLYTCVKEICNTIVGSLNECREALQAERNRIVKTTPHLSKLNELAIPGDAIPTTELLGTSLEMANIFDQLKSVAVHVLEMRQASFLRDGLEFISDSVCPFCLQETLTEQRKQEIRIQLQAHEAGLQLEDELRKSLHKFSSQWGVVKDDLYSKVGTRNSVKPALDEAIAILGKTSDTESLGNFYDIRLPELQKRIEETNKQVERFRQSCTNLLDHQPDLPIQKLITLSNKIRGDIEKVCATAYSSITELATLKSRILSCTPGMLPEMERKIKVIGALESLLGNAGHIKLAGIFDNKVLGLEGLQSKIEKFERDRMDEMLADLSADICHYWDKLNPQEPIKFTGLAVAGPGQRQVRIEGESYGKDINPVSCFSEAHVNCLGISLYLCQRVGKNPQFKFFVLDDPVQSMDEQHADRLIDVLREVSSDKQLIVLTHQKALCDMLDDVFGRRSYIKYCCGSYSKDGPQIEPEVGSIEKNLQLARTYSRGSKEDRINKSASSVRKAMEGVVKEILVDKYGIAKESLRSQRVRLSPRLQQLEGLGFDEDDIVSLRTILPIIDEPHHDDPNWDVPPQRIERAVEILESISQKHNIGPYHIVRTIVGRITDYLPKVGVAVIEVQQPFSIGDNLQIQGATTSMELCLTSMELEHQQIDTAKPGTLVGIRVPDKARPNDLVYKIAEDR